MGFERVTFTVSSAAAAENSVEITMLAVARELPGVNVERASVRSRTVMEGFDQRRARGAGQFVTKEEIARRNTEELSNVLRGLPGLVITRGRDGRPALRFLAHLAKRCLPQYWIDGRRVNAFEIDDLPASHVEGLELYDGPATTPGEFIRGPEFACGTVVIWTRVPILNVPGRSP
jgi:outer membrane receptor for ferrienterochelin and colicin